MYPRLIPLQYLQAVQILIGSTTKVTATTSVLSMAPMPQALGSLHTGSVCLWEETLWQYPPSLSRSVAIL